MGDANQNRSIYIALAVVVLLALVYGIARDGGLNFTWGHHHNRDDCTMTHSPAEGNAPDC